MTALSPPLSRQVRSGIFKALRLLFRLTPMPTATRDRLRQRFLDTYPDVRPIGPRGQAPSADARVRRAYVRSDERAIGYVPYSKGELPDPLPATLVAFYLPQFHTIPENDKWWGKGFTEWRNVTRALPQFEGHAQPRLPGDLGFYDLRDPEVMREQARLAREYGIGAFCFYFYWFGGKTLLETPLRNWLADPTIDFPFCLCWANEKWSRTWDGRGDEILIDQQHSPEDDLAFIQHVAKYMCDVRYLRVEGKPILLIYRPGLFPDMAATAARWREWCLQNGVGEIHLAYVQSFERPHPKMIGFDSAVEFPPNLHTAVVVSGNQHLINPAHDGQVLDWRELARAHEGRETTEYELHPGVNPSWDNEARRPGKGRTYAHASPLQYRDWLKTALHRLYNNRSSSKLIFINAWNEWAEGAVMEPDARLGYAYLEANRAALSIPVRHIKANDSSYCAILHAWHLNEFYEILASLLSSGLQWRIVVTTVKEHEKQIRSRLETLRMQFEILVFDNRGRDILPFLNAASTLLREGVEIVLKLHTKRSPHLENGRKWRQELVDALTGGSRAELILAAFSGQPDLGIVGPEGHMLLTREYMGSNKDSITYLKCRMGDYTASSDADVFVSGSMFWVRLEALRPLLDAHLSPSEFETEANQVDGTLGHAIERVFGICVRKAGFRVASAASICGELELQHGTYGYAHKD